MYPNLPIHKYPSFIFVEQLAYISPFNMTSSICECDKPLEPLSTCPTYSCYFYPLQHFLPFHIYPNLSIHKYPLSISVEEPTSIPPSPCPLVSVNVINHSSLSAHVLHISLQLFSPFHMYPNRPIHKYPSFIFF